jgi:hypothetical protein
MPIKEKCPPKNEKLILKKLSEGIVSDFFRQKQYYVVLQYLFWACILLFWHAFYFFDMAWHAK